MVLAFVASLLVGVVQAGNKTDPQSPVSTVSRMETTSVRPSHHRWGSYWSSHPVASKPRPRVRVAAEVIQRPQRPQGRAQVASAPASRGGAVMGSGDASWYDNPPCGANGAAMLAYTWGNRYFDVLVSHAGRSIVVTVCDNGPHVAGRIIDLGPSAFRNLCPNCDGIISGVTVQRL